MSKVQQLADDFVRSLGVFVGDNFNDPAIWYRMDKDLKVIGGDYIDRGDVHDFGIHIGPTDPNDYSLGVTITLAVKEKLNSGYITFDIYVNDTHAISNLLNGKMQGSNKKKDPQSDYDRAMGII